MHRHLAIIPSYQPQQELRQVIADVTALNVPIVLVDDGSTKETYIFSELEREYPSLTLIRHSSNKGKGAALKTAIAHILEHTDATHIITIDADGQHVQEDIARLLLKHEQSPEAALLGVRDFNSDTPLRSYIGNMTTKILFRILAGSSISDTQTGLRSFPRELARSFLSIEKDRYDFEMAMLMLMARAKVPILQIRISTVYIEHNESSHFRPLIDSLLIYKMLLKYSVASFVSILFDYALFFIFYSSGFAVLQANIMARVIAFPLNFYLNKTHVFKSSAFSKTNLSLYVALVCINPFISAFIIELLLSHTVPVAFAKVIAESSLFLSNYIIQKNVIFKQKYA